MLGARAFSLEVIAMPRSRMRSGLGVVQFQTLVRGGLVSTVAVPDQRVAETLVVPLDQRGRPCWGAPLVERRYPERIDVAGLEAAHAAMVAAVEEGRYDAPAEGGGASC